MHCDIAEIRIRYAPLRKSHSPRQMALCAETAPIQKTSDSSDEYSKPQCRRKQIEYGGNRLALDSAIDQAQCNGGYESPVDVQPCDSETLGRAKRVEYVQQIVREIRPMIESIEKPCADNAGHHDKKSEVEHEVRMDSGAARSSLDKDQSNEERYRQRQSVG